MIIRIIIACLLALPALFLTARYNLHMYQLNGYKNVEHLSWLVKKIRQQWILLFALALGIARIFFDYLALDIVIYMTLGLICLVYNAMRRMKAKKKLVYTARVKRQIVTGLTVFVALAVLVCLFFGIGYLIPYCAIMVGTQEVYVVVTGVINIPLEKMINRYYINDAKRLLKKSKDLKIIGITGSYGKTSVKFYLQTLLREKYSVLVTPESYNTPMGIVKTIRGSLKPTHEIFVCEMGARHVGDIKEDCDIVHPHMGVITSIGPQHLETFHSIENIKKTKFELADALPEGGALFLNGDNEYIMDKAKEYENKVFYFAGGEGSGYRAGDIKLSQFGTEFTVTAPGGEKEVFRMKLIGGHNVANVLGAIAVAHYLGIPLSELKIPVRQLEPVEHRMQMRTSGMVTIIDDAYNSNPVGSKAALDTLSMFDGTKILITPGMVELGEKESEYNFKFGTYAAECCDHILLVGKKRAEDIKNGVLSRDFPEEKCIVFEKVEDALSFAYSIKSQTNKYILLENDLPDNY